MCFNVFVMYMYLLVAKGYRYSRLCLCSVFCDCDDILVYKKRFVGRKSNKCCCMLRVLVAVCIGAAMLLLKA